MNDTDSLGTSVRDMLNRSLFGSVAKFGGPSLPSVKRSMSPIAHLPFFRTKNHGPRPARMIPLQGQTRKDHLGREVIAAVSSADFGKYFSDRFTRWWRSGSSDSTARHQRSAVDRRRRQKLCVHSVQSPEKHERLPNGMFVVVGADYAR